MALVVRIDGYRLTDPDGRKLVVSASVIENTEPAETQVRASDRVVIDAPATGSARAAVRDSLRDWGALVKANIASRDALSTQFPPVTTEITIP